MDFSVTKNGKPLDKKLYTWDEKTMTFSSNEDCLVLNFSGISGCTFDTGSDCAFDTGWDCTFDTGSGCTFDTRSGCTFKAGSGCTLDTGERCVVVRRGIYEVIELEEGKKIKLNGFMEKGFTYVDETPEEEQVTVKISKSTLELLKKEGVRVVK